MLVKQCHVYHPPNFITIFIGGMEIPFPVVGGLWHCFTHIGFRSFSAKTFEKHPIPVERWPRRLFTSFRLELDLTGKIPCIWWLKHLKKSAVGNHHPFFGKTQTYRKHIWNYQHLPTSTNIYQPGRDFFTSKSLKFGNRYCTLRTCCLIHQSWRSPKIRQVKPLTFGLQSFFFRRNPTVSNVSPCISMYLQVSPFFARWGPCSRWPVALTSRRRTLCCPCSPGSRWKRFRSRRSWSNKHGMWSTNSWAVSKTCGKIHQWL